MSPSQAGDQDHREAGTIITREAPMGEHFMSRASVVTTIWNNSTKKKCKEPKRRVSPSAFPLFGKELPGSAMRMWCAYGEGWAATE